MLKQWTVQVVGVLMELQKVNGHQRFIMVDILGLVFGAMVCPANIGEQGRCDY
jgi:hypothetical protein